MAAVFVLFLIGRKPVDGMPGFDYSHLKDFIIQIIGPTTTLVGTVLGFYFAGRASGPGGR